MHKREHFIFRLIAAALVAGIVFSPGYAAAYGNSELPYIDVPEDAWYFEAARFVTEQGVFKGTSDDTFSPDDTMTRGMFITAVGRYANVRFGDGEDSGAIAFSQVNMRTGPDTTYRIIAVLWEDTVVDILGVSGEWYYVRFEDKTGYIRSDLISADKGIFLDVSKESYYQPYVKWGACNDILEGVTENLFSPESYISRELICEALYNYAQATNQALEPIVPAIVFEDEQDIIYKESVYALQQAGIINGRGDGIFDPAAYATRAEVAAIFQRFNKAVGYRPQPEAGWSEDGGYIFGTALPERAAVPDSYFDDAAFVGHSFVTGMEVKGILPNAGFYGVGGSSAADFPKNIFPIFEDGKLLRYGPIEEALAETGYGKVYLFFGVNELGPEAYHRGRFERSMTALIETVREALPDAVIYLVSIAPVSKNCSQGSKSYNRSNVNAFNEVLKELSAEYEAVYLDIFSLLCDEEGYLPENLCLPDGIHLLSFSKLEDYFKTHTFER